MNPILSFNRLLMNKNEFWLNIATDNHLILTMFLYNFHQIIEISSLSNKYPVIESQHKL